MSEVPEGAPAGTRVVMKTMPMYGSYHGGDPRNFHPDEECQTRAERLAWKAACAAWAQGNEVESRQGGCDITEGMILCQSGAFGLGTFDYEYEVLEIPHSACDSKGCDDCGGTGFLEEE